MLSFFASSGEVTAIGIELCYEFSFCLVRTVGFIKLHLHRR